MTYSRQLPRSYEVPGTLGRPSTAISPVVLPGQSRATRGLPQAPKATEAIPKGLVTTRYLRQRNSRKPKLPTSCYVRRYKALPMDIFVRVTNFGHVISALPKYRPHRSMGTTNVNYFFFVAQNVFQLFLRRKNY